MGRWSGFEEAVAVADALSFSGAARRLGVSTSHVSRAVVQLEDMIRTPLFARTTRTVSLTDAGRIVVEQARRMIEEREETLALISSNNEPRGAVRITCSTSMGERFIVPIVHNFAKRYTDVSIELELTNGIVDLVGEGFDLGIRTGTISDSWLMKVAVASRGLTLCAAPAYLASAGKLSSVADLVDHQCLAGTASSWTFSVKGELRHHAPTGRWKCNSGAAVLHACLAGMGICQLPDFYVSEHIGKGALVPLLELQRPAGEIIWAVYPQRRHLLPKIHLLVELLRTELGPSLNKA